MRIEVLDNFGPELKLSEFASGIDVDDARLNITLFVGRSTRRIRGRLSRARRFLGDTSPRLWAEER